MSPIALAGSVSHHLFSLLTAEPCRSPPPAVPESLTKTGLILHLPLVLTSTYTTTPALHRQHPRETLVGEGRLAAGVIFSYPSLLCIQSPFPRPAHPHIHATSFTKQFKNTIHNLSIRTTLLTHSQWRHFNRLKQIRLILIIEGIEKNPGPDSRGSMTISHVNINSITSPNRLHELDQFVTTNCVDILALTETKLDDNIHPSLFHLGDFHAPFTNHRNRHGGGTALYAHSSLPIKRRHELELPGEEWIWAQVNINDLSLLICCVYLPPNISAQRQTEFIARLTESTSIAQTYSPTSIIILGDMNVGNIFLQRTLQRTSGTTPFDTRLKDATDVLDLTQLITEPTRLDRDTANIRDLFFTSCPDIIIDSGVLSPFSQIDHFPIYAVIDIARPPTSPNRQVCIWDYDKLDSRLLTYILLNTDWDTLLSRDVEVAARDFTSTILNAAKQAIPMKTIQTGRRHKPWMTADLMQNIRKRDRLFRQAKQHQRDADWQRWKTQRNYVTDLNKRNREEYIQTKVHYLLQHKHSPFKYHSTLKTIIGRAGNHNIPPLADTDGSIRTDDIQKATLLNNHFAKQSHIEVNADHNPLNDNRRQIPNLDSIHVTSREVLDMLNSIEPNKSCGPDELPPKIVKLIALLIYEPLARLYNICLEKGIYPSIWKQANVHPIYKRKGSPSDPTNYRPISLLPCLSKVFGKIIFKHIYKHLTDNQLISDKQSGYRPGHSTQLQLLHLTHNMYSNLDKGNDFTAIYLDISKYFDRIWHKGLLIKCESEFGITGTLLKWLGSYLKDRKQRVRVGETFSTTATINAGCPQGSVLGPLLALLYLNGLTDRLENDALLFADDISLYAPHKSCNILQAQQSLQKDLNSIYSYGEVWHITFNATKTIMQTFSTKRDIQLPQLTFGGNAIQQTNAHKHLGLTLSKDLRFHSHVNELIQKVNRALSPLYSIAKYIPRDVLSQIYTTYVQPHFDYCDIVYDGHLTFHDSQRLQTLQNRAARLITGVPFRTPTNRLLRDLGWNTLSLRRNMHRLIMYHKLTNTNDRLPDYITRELPHTRRHDTSRALRNASTHSLPPNNTTLFQISFIPATTREWNKLPECIRSITSPRSFKREVFRLLGVPTPPLYYSLGTKIGNTLHTKLRVGMSDLNAHLYSIQKVMAPFCECRNVSETTTHFLLQCQLHVQCRARLHRTLSDILHIDFSQLPRDTQTHTLLHGTQLSTSERGGVARSFQSFLMESKRFHI